MMASVITNLMRRKQQEAKTGLESQQSSYFKKQSYINADNGVSYY